MVQYRVSHADHLSQPWQVHDLLPDFVVEDVWQFPARLRPDDTLADFRREMFAAVREFSSFGLAGLLFRLRFAIGRMLGWDDGPTASPPRSIRRRYESRHPDAGPAPDLDGSGFAPVYSLPDEYLGEIENKTVIAALHLARTSTNGGYAPRLAVYVMPKGRLGRFYMALIKPFRHWVVYPALLRATTRRWNASVAGRLLSD